MGLIETFERRFFGPPNPSRRKAIKTGVLVCGNLILASCRYEPTPILDNGQIKKAKQQEVEATILKNAKDKFHMEQIVEFPSSSGMIITVFTDNQKLGIDITAIDQTLLAGFNLIDSLSDSPVKTSLLKAREAVRNKRLGGKKINLFVSADPRACLSKDAQIAQIPQGQTAAEFCATTGTTAAIIVGTTSQLQGVPPPTDIVISIITAGAVDGKTLLFPGTPNETALTPEQSLASTTSHEGLHAVMRMIGIPQSSEEEQVVQQVEITLLTNYQTQPMIRTIPFQFPRE